MALFKKHRMRRTLQKALEDGELTEDELEEISRRQAELGVSDEFINQVRRDHFSKLMKPVLDRVKQTRRFSTEDERAILETAKRLHMTPQFEREFMTYRHLWEIETTGHFTPTSIDAGIRLVNNEVCYHWCPAVWKQVKVIRRNTGYVGGSVGFRVAKGVTLRMGRAVPTYDEYEGVVDISPGNLYVTNKKLVFAGVRRSTNVAYGRLAHYEIYRDGIELIKTSGKPDLFQMDTGDVEYIDALLQVIE